MFALAILTPESGLPEGSVLAVTNDQVTAAKKSHRVIPGVFTESAGQFQLYRNDDGFPSLVQYLWKSDR